MSDISRCIIIGGGVVGLTVARRLARDGHSVTLLERSASVGGEASWAGAGILAPRNPHRRDSLFHFQERSLALFPELCEELNVETEIDTEYERCGELQLVFTPDMLGIARSIEKIAVDRTMPDGEPVYTFHELDALTHLEPMASDRVLGALECRQAALVRNPRLLRALGQSCKVYGVNILENKLVTGLVKEGSRVTGVRLGDEILPSDVIVLAAGAWSSQFDAELNRLMPVHPVRGQMILLKVDQRPFTKILASGRNYLVPRKDGHVLLGATEEHEAGFHKRTTAKELSNLIKKGRSLAPAISSATVKATWAGLRPGTPDDRPYLGPVPGFEGLIAATGHFRAGLTLAPATAEYISSIIHKRPYPIDLALCLPGRSRSV